MAKQTVSEEEIQLRKRARRRLVGAVALAILAAVLLPMVFDEQVKPVGNVQIQIPDEKTAPPFQPAASPPISSPAPVSAPVSSQALPEKAPVVEAKPIEPAKPSEPAKPKEEKKHAAGPEYVVQLGVFSNSANVKELRAKLSASGIKTYVESLGDKTRVRAGPYPSRADAESARKKIAKSGLNGVVETR